MHSHTYVYGKGSNSIVEHLPVVATVATLLPQLGRVYFETVMTILPITLWLFNAS